MVKAVVTILQPLVIQLQHIHLQANHPQRFHIYNGKDYFLSEMTRVMTKMASRNHLTGISGSHPAHCRATLLVRSGSLIPSSIVNVSLSL
jgi:hypothetical protein